MNDRLAELQPHKLPKTTNSDLPELSDVEVKCLEHQQLMADHANLSLHIKELERYTQEYKLAVSEKSKMEIMKQMQYERELIRASFNKTLPYLSELSPAMKQIVIDDYERYGNILIISDEAKQVSRYIKERHDEIVKLEQGFQEVLDLFKDMATLVAEQSTMLDQIDHNIEATLEHTKQANSELRKARKYQSKQL